MAENIKQSNINEQSKMDMQRYAIYVARNRSIPEYKDGLKPVQRRILWDMYHDQKAINNTIKSARIMGDVVGKYHPHGDCLLGSTLVYCLDGNMYKIEDLCNNKIPFIHVLSIDQNTGRVVPAIAHSFRIGQYSKKIYHFILSNGATISCTGNHPIMDYHGNWIKAEDIDLQDELFIPYRKPLIHQNETTNNRPSIDGRMVQDIVYNYYYGQLPEGYVKHHKDKNPLNNQPQNFECKSRADHAKEHKDFISGLELGRESMFSENGKYRESIKKKNSTLIKLFNTDQGIRRFKHCISILEDRGLEITEVNYEKLRPEVYNLPKVDNLIAKGYGKSFEELISLKLESIGDLYKDQKVEIIDESYNNDLVSCVKRLNYANSVLATIYKSLDEILMNYGYIDYNTFTNVTQTTNTSEFFFNNTLLPKYYNEYPVIIDVQIEELDEAIPMYDFTVDGYENMLISVPSNNSDSLPLVCVHNSSVYGAMKPLVNWFEINEPLIIKQGNFGNFQGDGASAARYTEAKLSSFAVDCVISELQETNKVVDWDDNYDNTLLEPSYLPAAVPLLLINGASGIATGLKVEIPSHNINEVIDATIALLHDPNANIVLVPDTCMPCEIVDSDWVGITNTGTGNFKVRGIIETSEYNGYPALIIRSIPDNTYLDTITNKIDELIMNNKIVQIMKSIDKCTEEEIKFILQLKKGSDPEFVKQVLYKNTLLEKSYSVNFEVLDGITPVRLGYKSYLQAFILQRLETKFRLYCNRLQDKQTRYHQVDAFIKVITSGKMDTVINMIKKQKSTDNATIINYLVDKIKLTDLQAKFIINVQLYRLSAGYLAKYKQEAKELLEAIKEYERKIVDDTIIQKEIEDELLLYKSKYGKPRKSRIISIEQASNIPAGQFKLVITENNFIKKIQINEPIGNLKGDTPKSVLSVENRENILIFDELGKVYKLPVHKIAFSDRNSPGIDIRMVIKNLTSNINSVFYEPTVEKFSKSRAKYFIVILTKNGNIKKMDLDDIITATPSGIVYVKLEEGDIVQDIMILGLHSDVVVYNKNKALRIPCNDIPYLKRSTKGAKSMPNGEVEGLSVVTKDTTDIVVITNKGYINRLSPMALPATTRNKAPNKVIKLSKDDTIQAVYGVNVKDSIRIVSQSGTTEIKVSDLVVGSSISTGSKVLATRSDMIVKTNIIKAK